MQQLLIEFLPLIIFFIVYFIAIRFLPVLIITDKLPRGVQGTNNAFIIKMLPECYNWTGILAQEYYESKYRQNPINAFKVMWKSKYEREMELMGHAITIAFTHGKEREKQLDLHSHSLVEYYDCFTGFLKEDVKKELSNRLPEAEKWLLDNIDKVTSLKRL